ncbi:MAG: hypothetical protein IPK80_30720 [Nannocystis sp.]|nr:hypothetical protein [Nannocystis sp.]
MIWSTWAVLGALGLHPSPDVVGEREADRARIQRHLTDVEAELRARDVAHLPATLQEARRRNLERLRAYRLAGEFPRNSDFPGERIPYFIDEDGVLCAVGFLVVDSGSPEVALEIQETENNARLLDMVHPALPAWIAASGLTADECARIQPAYCNCGNEDAPVCGVDGKSYANACYAQTCAWREIAHEGLCMGPGTTGWPLTGTSGGEETDSGTSGTTEGADTSGGAGSSDGTGEEPPRESREGCEGCRAGVASGPAALVGLLGPFALLRRRRARA